MHISLRVTAAFIAATFALTACTGDPKPRDPGQDFIDNPPSYGAVEPENPSSPATSEGSRADLTRLSIQKLTGPAPTTLPVWKPGGDPAKYSVDTLRFLVAAAKKAGIAVPEVKYAIYAGSNKLVVDCTGNTSTEVPAKETGAALYCKEVNGILLVPNNWSQTDPWDADIDKVGVHPLYYIIEALATYIDGATFSKQDCYEGKLYGGITLTQPSLGKRVAAYLAPAGKMEYHPTEEWRNSAYADVVAGTARPC